MPPRQTNQPFQPYPVPAAGQPGGMVPPSPPQHGSGGLIISLVLSILLLVGAAAFGLWAYGGMQDYKTNADQKATKAVAVAVQAEDIKKAADFAEQEKSPLKTYLGPEAYGSLSISYPKTWGAYVIQLDRSTLPIDGYFHPNFVPGTQSGTAYALRVQVTSQTYDLEMKQFESKVKGGKVTVTPFTAKNVPGVVGARVDGEINNGQKDSMILLPLRDKTLKISTESPDFVNDFNSIILPNLKFVP